MFTSLKIACFQSSNRSSDLVKNLTSKNILLTPFNPRTDGGRMSAPPPEGCLRKRRKRRNRGERREIWYDYSSINISISQFFNFLTTPL